MIQKNRKFTRQAAQIARLVQKEEKRLHRREHILMICRKQEYADYSTAFCRYTGGDPGRLKRAACMLQKEEMAKHEKKNKKGRSGPPCFGSCSYSGNTSGGRGSAGADRKSLAGTEEGQFLLMLILTDSKETSQTESVKETPRQRQGVPERKTQLIPRS